MAKASLLFHTDKKCGGGYISNAFICHKGGVKGYQAQLKEPGSKARKKSLKSLITKKTTPKKSAAKGGSRKQSGDGFLSEQQRAKLPEDLRIVHDYMVKSGLYSKEKPDLDVTKLGGSARKLAGELWGLAQKKRVLKPGGDVASYDDIVIQTNETKFPTKASFSVTQGKGANKGKEYANLTYVVPSEVESPRLGISKIIPTFSGVRVQIGGFYRGMGEGADPPMTFISTIQSPKDFDKFRESRTSQPKAGPKTKTDLTAKANREVARIRKIKDPAARLKAAQAHLDDQIRRGIEYGRGAGQKARNEAKKAVADARRALDNSQRPEATERASMPARRPGGATLYRTGLKNGPKYLSIDSIEPFLLRK